jgi:hypothetical protein
MSRRVLRTVFAREEDLLLAVRALREQRFVIDDIHTPYAVHGLDRVAGLKPSRVSWVGATFAFLAAFGIMAFQVWTSAVSWPINVGGKPFASHPSFVPATFEMGVLLGGLGSVAALLVSARLYPGKRARLVHPGVTDDRFVVTLAETDASFDVAQTRALCERLGAVEVFEQVIAEEAR